jgi:hypothetical protein
LRNAARCDQDFVMICDQAIAVVKTYDDLIAAIRTRIALN